MLQLIFLLAFASKIGSWFALSGERSRGTCWLLLRASTTRPSAGEMAISSTAKFRSIEAAKLKKV